jgi:hypothetical protein
MTRSYSDIAEAFQIVYDEWEKREIETVLALVLFQSLVEELLHTSPTTPSEYDSFVADRMLKIVQTFESKWIVHDDEEYEELVAARCLQAQLDNE